MNRCLNFLWTLFTCFGLYSCNQPESESIRQKQRLPETATEILAFNYQYNHHLKDTNAIKQQISLGEELWDKNQDSAKKLLLEATKVSYRLNYYKGIINSLRHIASVYSSANNIDSTLFYYNIMIYAAQQLSPELAIKELIYADIGSLYFTRGMSDSAFTYLYKAVNPLKGYTLSGEYSLRNAYAIYQIAAAMWINSGDPETALPYVKEAEKMAIALQDSGKIMAVLHLTATTHFRKKSYDTALFLYKKVLYNKASSDGIKLQTLTNLANLYINRKKCNADSALYYAQKAIQLNRQLYGNDSSKGMMTQYILACAYAHKGEHDKDSSNFRRAEEILSQLNDNQLSGIISGGELVHFYAGQASFAAVNHKNFERAYELNKKALRLRDSLYNNDVLQQRAKMDALYRIAQRDKDLAEKQVQLLAAEKKVIKKNELILYIICAALFSITLLFWRYLYIRQKNNRLANSREMEVLKAKLNAEEQERERISYDLHDSINSRLASTQSFLIALQQGYPFLKRENDFNRIAQNLKDISTDVRQIAHNLAPPDLISKKLPMAIKDFCTELLTPRNIACEVQVLGSFEDVSMDYCLTLYRIAQELLHNIVKHAEATEVIVILAKQDEVISLLVEDNGNGADWPDADSGRTGIGILGLQNRIKSLNGTLHKEIRKGQGTTIQITAPYPPSVARTKKNPENNPVDSGNNSTFMQS